MGHGVLIKRRISARVYTSTKTVFVPGRPRARVCTNFMEKLADENCYYKPRSLSCVSAVQESQGEESYQSHELGLITSKVTCLQEGVGNSLVVSSGVPITKDYHARLGSSTLHSSQIHGEPSLVEFYPQFHLPHNTWIELHTTTVYVCGGGATYSWAELHHGIAECNSWCNLSQCFLTQIICRS